MAPRLPDKPAICPTCGALAQGGPLLPLSRRQKAVLRWIADYLEAHGCAPSFQEIADGVGKKSKGGSALLINALVARGWLLKKPYLARAIDLTPAARQALAANARLEKNNHEGLQETL
jgi:SOS-response transcriptional repressor LexA